MMATYYGNILREILKLMDEKKTTLHKRGMGVVCTISDTLVL